MEPNLPLPTHPDAAPLCPSLGFHPRKTRICETNRPTPLLSINYPRKRTQSNRPIGFVPLQSDLVVVQNVSKLGRLQERPGDRLPELLPAARPRHTSFRPLQGETLNLFIPNGCGNPVAAAVGRRRAGQDLSHNLAVGDVKSLAVVWRRRAGQDLSYNLAVGDVKPLAVGRRRAGQDLSHNLAVGDVKLLAVVWRRRAGQDLSHNLAVGDVKPLAVANRRAKVAWRVSR